MQAINEIRMKILKDGTVSIDTDAFEEEVHQQAEELIKETCEALGGERQVVETKRDHQHTHTHLSGHAHVHH
jgi:hypothetical protein